MIKELSNKLFYKYIHAKKWVPDALYVKWRYFAHIGKKLNLKNPVTYNEKIQWMKLYDRNPYYTKCADKYEAKNIVKGLIGEEYIIPIYGVWDTFDEINFDELPNSFVLKCTHDSGGIYICKDKSKLDIAYAKTVLESSLKTNFFYYGREWVYKDIRPRIIAEKYMEEGEGLDDYKFFCFDGVPKIMFVGTERMKEGEEVKFDFFDMEFNNLHIINGHPNAKIEIKKPKSFEEMKKLAEILSKGFRHVRVDFYEIDGRPYFGEYTFYHHCGLVPFEPEIWDKTMGDWIKI